MLPTLEAAADTMFDHFLRAHGLRPEEPVMGRFGARVLMLRSL